MIIPTHLGPAFAAARQADLRDDTRRRRTTPRGASHTTGRPRLTLFARLRATFRLLVATVSVDGLPRR